MSEPDFLDIWGQASPFQLLRFLKLLSVEQQSIATHLDVTISSVSMWINGHRAVPTKYRPPLLAYTQVALPKAMKRHHKEVSALPEPLKVAAIEEFHAALGRWQLEVLHEKGMLTSAIKRNCRRIAAYEAQETLPPSERRALMTLCRVVQSQLRTIEALEVSQDIPQDGQDE